MKKIFLNCWYVLKAILTVIGLVVFLILAGTISTVKDGLLFLLFFLISLIPMHLARKQGWGKGYVKN